MKARSLGAAGALSLTLLLGGCFDVEPLRDGEPNAMIPRRMLDSLGVVGEHGKPQIAPGCSMKPFTPAPTPANPSPAAQEQTVQDPVTCYWQVKSEIDYAYQKYKTDLFHAVNTGNFALDFVGLGLTTAGAITPGADAARLFSALATGVTGTKGAIDSDVLYKQTINIVLNEMDTDREQVSTNNQQDLDGKPDDTGKPTKPLTWPVAVNDLLAYYEAGTFQHALVTLLGKSSLPVQSSAPSTNDTGGKGAKKAAPAPAAKPAGKPAGKAAGHPAALLEPAPEPASPPAAAPVPAGRVPGSGDRRGQTAGGNPPMP